MAERVAAENGAVIVSWTSIGTPDGAHHAGGTIVEVSVEVTVEVRAGSATASARATNAP